MVHEGMRIVRDREFGNMTEYVGYDYVKPYNVSSVCGGTCCNPSAKDPHANEDIDWHELDAAYAGLMSRPDFTRGNLSTSAQVSGQGMRDSTNSAEAESLKSKLEQSKLPVKFEKKLFDW